MFSEKVMPQIIDYTYKQGDIVAYSLTVPEGVLEGTGRIVGVATTHLPILGSIYMVFDAENFPNSIYPYTTIPMQESALELIGHVDEQYLLISNGSLRTGEDTYVDNFKSDYKAAKKAFDMNKDDDYSLHQLVSVIKHT